MAVPLGVGDQLTDDEQQVVAETGPRDGQPFGLELLEEAARDVAGPRYAARLPVELDCLPQRFDGVRRGEGKARA